MSNRGVRVLVGAVGAFAVARGVGQLTELFQLIASLFAPRDYVLLDWITALAVISPVVLVGLGVALLIRPPAWVMRCLCASDSISLRLRGAVGVFLLVVAVEQVYRFSAIFERTIDTMLHWAPILGFITLVVFGFLPPVGLGALGIVLILRAGRATGNEAERDARGEGAEAPLANMWSILATLIGAMILALAMPTLSEFLAYIGLNYQPGAAAGPRTWIALHTSTTLLSFFLQVGIAVYLLVGAPGFVRWHLTKVGSQTEAEPNGSSC